MKNIPIPDEVVSLVHAIRDDGPLREWLFLLEQHTDSVRRSAFAGMIAKMRAASEDGTLIAAMEELARPEIYAAACRALRELQP